MAYWGNNKYWRSLSGPERAAAMALLEADIRNGRIDVDSARNALGAMINRSARDRVDLGEHVSQRIYQPTIEDKQFARLSRVIGSPEHRQLTELAQSRLTGQTEDWVQGATHFLAPEKTMLALEAREPMKYRSWRKWTGFNPQTNEYNGVLFRDGSHAFLAPEGAYSAPAQSGAQKLQVAQVDPQTPPSPAPSPSTRTTFQPSVSAGQPHANASVDAGLLGSLFSAPVSGIPAGTLNSNAEQQTPSPPQAQPEAPVSPVGHGFSIASKPIDLRRLMAVLQNRTKPGWDV